MRLTRFTAEKLYCCKSLKPLPWVSFWNFQTTLFLLIWGCSRESNNNFPDSSHSVFQATLFPLDYKQIFNMLTSIYHIIPNNHNTKSQSSQNKQEAPCLHTTFAIQLLFGWTFKNVCLLTIPRSPLWAQIVQMHKGPHGSLELHIMMKSFISSW